MVSWLHTAQSVIAGFTESSCRIQRHSHITYEVHNSIQGAQRTEIYIYRNIARQELPGSKGRMAEMVLYDVAALPFPPYSTCYQVITRTYTVGREIIAVYCSDCECIHVYTLYKVEFPVIPLSIIMHTGWRSRFFAASVEVEQSSQGRL